MDTFMSVFIYISYGMCIAYLLVMLVLVWDTSMKIIRKEYARPAYALDEFLDSVMKLALVALVAMAGAFALSVTVYVVQRLGFIGMSWLLV